MSNLRRRTNETTQVRRGPKNVIEDSFLWSLYVKESSHQSAKLIRRKIKEIVLYVGSDIKFIILLVSKLKH